MPPSSKATQAPSACVALEEGSRLDGAVVGGLRGATAAGQGEDASTRGSQHSRTADQPQCPVCICVGEGAPRRLRSGLADRSHRGDRRGVGVRSAGSEQLVLTRAEWGRTWQRRRLCRARSRFRRRQRSRESLRYATVRPASHRRPAPPMYWKSPTRPGNHLRRQVSLAPNRSHCSRSMNRTDTSRARSGPCPDQLPTEDCANYRFAWSM